MSSLHSLGFRSSRVGNSDGNRIEHVVPLRALHRVLAFTGRSLDDVVNDPIAKNKVLGYYKLDKWINRNLEIHDLEQQWNLLHL